MAVAVFSPLPAAAASVASPASCRLIDTTVPGSVTDKQVVPAAGTSAADYTVHGELCTPTKGPAARTVLLALHGITYTHLYWNSGFEPGALLLSPAPWPGRATPTFAIDRLGYGDSSRPPSALVSLDSGAEVAHQLIGQLREGHIGGTAFKRVSWSATATVRRRPGGRARSNNDADANDRHGVGSTIQSAPLARFFTSFYPASADPKFAQKALDPGYLTPLPGTRRVDFLYNLSNVDPKVVAYDETVMRDTVTWAEGFTFYNRYGAIPLGPCPWGPRPSTPSCRCRTRPRPSPSPASW